jgi:hypothetical protein
VVGGSNPLAPTNWLSKMTWCTPIIRLNAANKHLTSFPG